MNRDFNKMYPSPRPRREVKDNRVLFASEIPTAHLDEIHPMIDIHFVIATECIKDQAYFDWYCNRPRDAKVILDNGMFEEGKPMNTEDLISVAKAIKPEVVFAPDVVGDRYLTMAMTEEFIALSNQIGASWEVGVIPQGKDVEDIVSCYNFFIHCTKFNGPIGISFLNDRKAFVKYMSEHKYWYTHHWHHFLGMYDVYEIPTWPKCVKSMDTIKPFKAAMRGIKLDSCPRGLGIWNTSLTMPEIYKPLMIENYRRMKQILERPEIDYGD